jgi:phage shock protein C
MKKLTLDQHNRKWLGVCAGLANYFEVDVTVIRLIVVVVTLMTTIFPGLLAYLIAGLIIPKQGEV